MSKTNRAARALVWGILCLSCVPAALGQGRYIEIAIRNSRPSIYHEAIVLPSSEGGSVSVHFRIPNSLLVFLQRGDVFVADVEATVEVFSEKRKRDERTWHGSTSAATFDVTQSKTTDLAGFVEFGLPPGEYSYRLLLNEGATLDRRSAQPKAIVVPDPASQEVWRPFFVSEIKTSEAMLELTPTGLGGEAPFADSAEAAVPVLGLLEDAAVEYFLYSVAPENEEALQKAGRLEHYNIRNGDLLVRQGTARTIVPFGADADDCFCRDLTTDSSIHLALLDLETETLEAGFYVADIRVKRGGKSASSQLIFTTHWRDMPISLYDVEVAIRNLEFIDTRERVRSMLKGSRRERIEQLRAYWKQRDPTPGTLANELMEEYYRRVDQAALEYRTGGAPYPDGLRTDAARIYIVNGPPEEVTHSFPSSGGVEQVWRYGDGRTFVFRSNSSLEPLVLVEDRG